MKSQANNLNVLSPVCKKVLEVIQEDLPLTETPFEYVAKKSGTGEEETIIALRELARLKILREVALIYDAERVGYSSALVGMHLPEETQMICREIMLAHPGISHAYIREHPLLNLWFTIAVPPGASLEEEVADIAKTLGSDDYYILRAKRHYKLRVYIPVATNKWDQQDCKNNKEAQRQVPEDINSSIPVKNTLPSEDDWRIIEIAQGGIPLTSRPFKEIATAAGISEKELIDKLVYFKEMGWLRRFSGILYHTNAGMKSNALVAWALPEKDTLGYDTIAQKFSRLPFVSHCYYREPHKEGWHYPLFTMIHARTPQELQSHIQIMREHARHATFIVMPTLHEIKKKRVRLYSPYNKHRA